MKLHLSLKKNVLQVTALMLKKRVTRVVVCPGSRNAPLVHTFASHPDFECREVTDERSAAFIALGWIQQSGLPVAICCTSGSALLNFSPAVAEAYYQQLPLLVLSADRPEMWIGQMDGQTIPQAEALFPFVAKEVQLLEPKTKEEAWQCNRLINEALLPLERDMPTHINIPITEPIFDFGKVELPQERVVECLKISSVSTLVSVLQIKINQLNPQRVLCVIGQDSLCRISAEAVEQLRRKKVLILAEHLSNIKSDIQRFEEGLLQLESAEEDAYVPDVLITVGGHLVSKQLKAFFRQHPLKAHWHFTPDLQQMPDVFQHLTHLIPASKEEAIQALSQLDFTNLEEAFVMRWKAFDKHPFPIGKWNERTVIARFLALMPLHAALQVANSSSVRLVQRFSLPLDTLYYVNRGVNGIEGSLSTAVGYAAKSERITFVVIGDLSFFYDLNALWNKHHGGNLRILLLNNGRGKIFDKLPRAQESPYLHSHIAGEHATSAEQAAALYQCSYASVNTLEVLDEKLKDFVASDAEKTKILEIKLN